MTDSLFDEWRAYQKLLEHDYMYHVAFFNHLKHEIQLCFNGPVTILDLGCGDVSPIQPILEDLDIRLYCGIDQSETAISKAESCLASLDVPSRVYQGDLLDTLQTLTGQYDVIVASFSLHHLQTAEAKQKVLEECRRVLNPAGLVAIIDVFHAEGETRTQYLRRWVNFAKSSYKTLDHVEMASLVEHAQSNDFPETLSTYQFIARAAGYDKFEVLMQDKEKFNHLVTLRE
ncbi:MAG: class I SAM-dependent methyltransferase [Xanthomonadales bacterium]